MYFNGNVIFKMRSNLEGDYDFTNAKNTKAIDKAEDALLKEGFNIEIINIASDKIILNIKANDKPSYDTICREFGHWCAEYGMRKYVSQKPNPRLFETEQE